jgi:hypothetical protein
MYHVLGWESKDFLLENIELEVLWIIFSIPVPIFLERSKNLGVFPKNAIGGHDSCPPTRVSQIY